MRERNTVLIVTAVVTVLIIMFTVLTLRNKCGDTPLAQCIWVEPKILLEEFIRYETLLLIPLIISVYFLFKHYKIERAIPAIISGLGSGIASGLSIMEALEMVCVKAYEPVSSVLRELVWKARTGADISDELKLLETKIKHPYAPFLIITLSNILLEPFRASAIVKSVSEALLAYDKNTKRLRGELSIYKLVVGVILVTFSIIFSLLYKLIGGIITELPSGFALGALDINILVILNFFAIIIFSIMSAIYVNKITKSPPLAAIPLSITYLIASTVAYYIVYLSL